MSNETVEMSSDEAKAILWKLTKPDNSEVVSLNEFYDAVEGLGGKVEESHNCALLVSHPKLNDSFQVFARGSEGMHRPLRPDAKAGIRKMALS